MARPLPLLLAAALTTACAHAEARRVGSHLPGDPTWPRGPGQRIAWVGEIRGPENLGIERGFWARLWDLITGQDDLEGLYRPSGVAVDAAGRVAVADPGRRLVHLYDPARGRSLRLRGEGREELVFPVAVAFLGPTLLVADAEAGALRAFDEEGRPTPLPLAVPRLARPGGLAVDPRRGRLYLADTLGDVVHVLPLAPGGQARVLGGRGADPGRFNRPTHLAVDAEGRLLVCDALNFRVQIFDADLGFRGAFGQNGDGLGDLSRPKGLAVDREGAVFVLDGYFDVVQVFEPEGRLLGVFGGSGVTPGRFWLAGGMALDTRGLLYVADTFNARVQVFDLGARAP